ncbi:helix-turn-helix transcriptional regulator [Candidatus Roizmanbacteria bacterium]|nr:helix-turn-helix transcriptional regulator [Candidatus Roizmanbacteria bacterium]
MKGNHFYKRLGYRIRQKRKVKYFSQEKLAFYSAIDRTYLARIEEGKANPSVKVMYKICKVLQTRLSELLEGV